MICPKSPNNNTIQRHSNRLDNRYCCSCLTLLFSLWRCCLVGGNSLACFAKEVRIGRHCQQNGCVFLVRVMASTGRGSFVFGSLCCSHGSHYYYSSRERNQPPITIAIMTLLVRLRRSGTKDATSRLGCGGCLVSVSPPQVRPSDRVILDISVCPLIRYQGVCPLIRHDRTDSHNDQAPRRIFGRYGHGLYRMRSWSSVSSLYRTTTTTTQQLHSLSLSLSFIQAEDCPIYTNQQAGPTTQWTLPLRVVWDRRPFP